MNLNEWAIKHGVSFEAVEDLRAGLGAVNTDPTPVDNDGSESFIQTSARLEATQKGARLWRNNVGATYTDDGRFLRYGLANDSKRMNEVIKSSDLIGIRPVHITPKMINTTVGVFVARECKPEGWVYTGTPRELAQLKFLELITSLGGDAGFANSVGIL